MLIGRFSSVIKGKTVVSRIWVCDSVVVSVGSPARLVDGRYFLLDGR